MTEEIAPFACIVCEKSAPPTPTGEGWAYLANAVPTGAMTCGDACTRVAVTRHNRGLRVDGKGPR